MRETRSVAVIVSSLTSVKRAPGALNQKFLLFRIRYKDKCFLSRTRTWVNIWRQGCSSRATELCKPVRKNITYVTVTMFWTWGHCGGFLRKKKTTDFQDDSDDFQYEVCILKYFNLLRSIKSQSEFQRIVLQQTLGSSSIQISNRH